MAYWLVKSEPSSWSWDDQVRVGTTPWDGVRNPMATANLRAMQVGDRAFFYHSNEGKAVVGIVEVAKTFYPDPKDAAGKTGMVDVTAIRPFKRPVTLSEVKADPALKEMVLVRNSRLSVQPVTAEEWRLVCKRGETDPS